MHVYHEKNGRFPARAVFDEDGKPLLSWRVHPLPFFQEDNIYKQFHMDESWDSEHNKTLLAKMPKVYKNLSSSSGLGKADYLAVVGDGLAFEGDRGRHIADFLDGTSDTVLLVEVDPDRAVPWTKPDDWEFDAEHPLAGLGRAHPGGFCAAFADGSTRFIPDTIDLKVFQAWLTIAGGEAANPPSELTQK